MIIIHGDDYVASRLYLNDLIDKAKVANQNVTRVEAGSMDFNEVVQVTESSSLFGNDNLLVIFGFFSLSKSKKKDKFIDYLKNHQDTSLVIYEDKLVGATYLKAFSKAQVSAHKPAAIIFNFLDSLKPHQPEKSLGLYQKLLDQQTPAELIFAMFLRQIHLLLLATNPDSLKMPPWMKNKLITQSRAFGLITLQEIHNSLYQIDKNIKTGRNPTTLSFQLFNLLANL